MTVALPLAFPGSRVLAGWWRQLASSKPRALWVGHLLLHDVEALVQVNSSTALDRFSQLVVTALAIAHPRNASTHAQLPRQSQLCHALASLDQTLHLDRPMLRQVLRGLEKQGLVASHTPASERAGNASAEFWTLTTSGRQAAERGHYSRSACERRAFCFVQTGAGRAGLHFLNATHACFVQGTTSLVAESIEFRPEALTACVRQPQTWKELHGFPIEIDKVFTSSSSKHEAAAMDTSEVLETSQVCDEVEAPWLPVVLDRPRHLVVALLLGVDGPDRLTGFAVRPEGWILHAAVPCFTLEAAAWPDVFPELVAEPPQDMWQQAWRAWCQPRNLPAQETDACGLERAGARLRVRMSKRLADRLRALRSDIFKGEAWILAGEGPLRQAAVLEVIEG
jgi:hypothetical protein